MNKKYLTKSDYCKGAQCEKILWLTKYNPNNSESKDSNPFFETGSQVGELAKGYFGDYEDVPLGKISTRVERTEKLLKDKPNVITEASFYFDNNFCSVDILKNDSDGVEIYEVKSTTKFKEINLDDPSYQYFVLSSLGLTVKKVCVVYLNNKYKRQGDLDIHKLFKIKDITSTAKQKHDEIRNKINTINEFMEKYSKGNEPDKQIGMQCFKPSDCEFFDYCTKDLPKPNIFDLKCRMRDSTKIKKYNENKISFKDLEHEKLRDKCREQIDFELNNREPKIEKEKIKELLSKLKYPLYFIDYEACNFAIPQYEGTHAYQQIPFQYSLHIIREEGAPPEHKEFLAEVDDENIVRTFAESMINALPEDGSVIVYYMPFEKSHVNKKIAKMYPDLKSEIDRINGNMVDFEVPFKDRFYYIKEMEGSSSIKYVLPALFPDDDKLNYSNQPLVHNGLEASQAFLRLKDETPEEQEKIREGLLEYCKLDTYAMVKIWEKFKEVTEGD